MGLLVKLSQWWSSIAKSFTINKPVGKKLICSICGKELNFINGFLCRHCNKYHCEIHRIPEQHRCPNPRRPRSGFVEIHKADGTISVLGK